MLGQSVFFMSFSRKTVYMFYGVFIGFYNKLNMGQWKKVVKHAFIKYVYSTDDWLEQSWTFL